MSELLPHLSAPRGRPVRAALGAHRQPEPRPGPVPDEQRHRSRRTGRASARGSPTDSARENADLPGFVVLCPGRPVRFAELWASAFLPSRVSRARTSTTRTSTRGRWCRTSTTPPRPPRPSAGNSTCCGELNRDHAAERGGDPALEARIQTMETAFRMQTAASDAFDLHREPTRVREMYGTRPLRERAACWPGGWPSAACASCRSTTATASRGTRTATTTTRRASWPRTSTARSRALLTDLKRRGLLDDTLVMWGGEFGRTPTTEGGDGRDHNHYGFTMWLAGGGVEGRHGLRRDRRLRLPGRARTRSTSTTCTRPCCT